MQLEAGMIVTGKVSGITGFGAFVDLPEDKTGMVHISEVSTSYVDNINEHLKIGQEVKVKVLSIDPKGKISLSIRKAEAKPFAKKPFETKNNSHSHGGRSSPAGYEWSAPKKSSEPASFEDMMSHFKQSSDERMSCLKRNEQTSRRPRRNNKPER